LVYYERQGQLALPFLLIHPFADGAFIYGQGFGYFLKDRPAARLVLPPVAAWSMNSSKTVQPERATYWGQLTKGKKSTA